VFCQENWGHVRVTGLLGAGARKQKREMVGKIKEKKNKVILEGEKTEKDNKLINKKRQKERKNKDR
jgi:fructose-specific component phosphotransferase system IIB-like protein